MDGTPAACAPRRAWFVARGGGRNWLTVEAGPWRLGLRCAACGDSLARAADLVVLRDLARFPGWETAATTPLCLSCVLTLGRSPTVWGALLVGGRSGLCAPPGGRWADGGRPGRSAGAAGHDAGLVRLADALSGGRW